MNENQWLNNNIVIYLYTMKNIFDYVDCDTTFLKYENISSPITNESIYT